MPVYDPICLICGAHEDTCELEQVVDPVTDKDFGKTLCSNCHQALKHFKFNLGWIDNAAHYIWNRRACYRRP